MGGYEAVMTDQDQSQASGLQGHFLAIRARLHRFLVTRMGNANDAEDILQELWLKLDRSETGPVTSPDAYLHKMALNLANDLVRARGRSGARDKAWLEATGGEADPAPSQERQLSGQQQLAVLQKAIAALPERAGEVFRRHRLEGESHGEIAAALGISKSAVEKNMATAMRYLLDAMNQAEGD